MKGAAKLPIQGKLVDNDFELVLTEEYLGGPALNHVPAIVS